MGLEQIKVELQDWMGDDRAIANAAWTSSHDKEVREYRTNDDVDRVIRFMAKHKHGTPFESVVFRFWFRWPIFTDRQHMTHRIASHNGLSGRYRTLPEDFYNLPEDVKILLDKIEKHSPPFSNEIGSNYQFMIEASIAAYKDILYFSKKAQDDSLISNAEYKRIREVARGLVPTASMTERTTVMNLRSFANYQKLRNSDHAQPEIAHASRLMLEQIKEKGICPVAIASLEEAGWQI